MNSMKVTQGAIGMSIAYFSVRLAIDSSEESKSCSFMALICLLIILLLLSHINHTNKQLRDEINSKIDGNGAVANNNRSDSSDARKGGDKTNK